jgi:hypothetical protein
VKCLFPLPQLENVECHGFLGFSGTNVIYRRVLPIEVGRLAIVTRQIDRGAGGNLNSEGAVVQRLFRKSGSRFNRQASGETTEVRTDTVFRRMMSETFQ